MRTGSGRFFLCLLFFVASANGQEKRNKFEELFLWKVSDELKLTAHEEKQFSDLFKTLGNKKIEIAKAQDDIITQLTKTKLDKDRTGLLTQFRKLLEEYNRIQLQEFDDAKKIFGTERSARYLIVKRDLTNKVKTLISEKSAEKEKADKKELPPPKLIEE